MQSPVSSNGFFKVFMKHQQFSRKEVIKQYFISILSIPFYWVILSHPVKYCDDSWSFRYWGVAARGLVGCSWWCKSGTSETCCCGAICADGLDCCGTSCADAGARCHRGDVINIPSWWGPWTWAYCSWRKPWRPWTLRQLYGTFWDFAATHQCDIFFFNAGDMGWGHGHITMAHSCPLQAAWHMHNATGAQTIWHLMTQCESRRQGSKAKFSPNLKSA